MYCHLRESFCLIIFIFFFSLYILSFDSVRSMNIGYFLSIFAILSSSFFSKYTNANTVISSVFIWSLYIFLDTCNQMTLLFSLHFICFDDFMQIERNSIQFDSIHFNGKRKKETFEFHNISLKISNSFKHFCDSMCCYSFSFTIIFLSFRLSSMLLLSLMLWNPHQMAN